MEINANKIHPFLHASIVMHLAYLLAAYLLITSVFGFCYIFFEKAMLTHLNADNVSACQACDTTTSGAGNTSLIPPDLWPLNRPDLLQYMWHHPAARLLVVDV